MTESPEFRTARQRTPEEQRAVFFANMRAFARNVRNAFSGLADAVVSAPPTATAPTFAPVAVPDFSAAIARTAAARFAGVRPNLSVLDELAK